MRLSFPEVGGSSARQWLLAATLSVVFSSVGFSEKRIPLPEVEVRTRELLPRAS
jgi:hypothetical protein